MVTNTYRISRFQVEAQKWFPFCLDYYSKSNTGISENILSNYFGRDGLISPPIGEKYWYLDTEARWICNGYVRVYHYNWVSDNGVSLKFRFKNEQDFILAKLLLE